jgi:uncharacterized membrane protein YfcA
LESQTTAIKPSEARISPFWYYSVGVLVIVVLSVFFINYEWIMESSSHISEYFGPEFFLFVIGGFIAQMIDGALGMAYGVSASTFLMSMGVPPAAASASIHTSEIFTSGVSGWMHFRFQNVNKKLFQTLLLPGIIGAILGAYLLSELENYNYIIKPVVAVYTFLLGLIIILKAIRNHSAKLKTSRIPLLASFGGLMDSIGGGGWGPIVSSTLIAGGRSPRYTVGSVNAAEFFVALASSITFFLFIGLHHLQVILGLIIGGIIAAPIAASITRKLPVKAMMIVVGVTVMLVSLRLIFIAFF